MKKFYLFIFIILCVIIFYFNFVGKPKNYNLSYNVDEFKILEKFNSNKKFYSFNISYNEQNFMFISENDYSKKRKLIKRIDFIDNESFYCLKPIVDNMDFEYICYDGVYKDQYTSGLRNYDKFKKIETKDNIDIYNKDYDYYIWNGKGISELFTGKDYNFLKNEIYDNQLSIVVDKYIMFVDYEQTHTFDKFYVFDSENKKMNEWNIKYEIDFDSYFMGNVENKVYLFDRKNMVQYKIDIIDKEIEICSDGDGALFYDDEWVNKPIKELKYKDYFMNNDNLYRFMIRDNKLYLNIDNTNDILVSNKQIKDILYVNENTVYYLVDQTVYSYNLKTGEVPLIKDFEWNFSYKNKIFIF